MLLFWKMFSVRFDWGCYRTWLLLRVNWLLCYRRNLRPLLGFAGLLVQCDLLWPSLLGTFTNLVKNSFTSWGLQGLVLAPWLWLGSVVWIDTPRASLPGSSSIVTPQLEWSCRVPVFHTWSKSQVSWLCVSFTLGKRSNRSKEVSCLTWDICKKNHVSSLLMKAWETSLSKLSLPKLGEWGAHCARLFLVLSTYVLAGFPRWR